MASINISNIISAMFYDRPQWSSISTDEKIGSFFILNRYFSKHYPSYSALLNSKNIDPICGLELWREYIKENEKTYPSWLWKKGGVNKKDKETMKKEDIDILRQYIDIDDKSFDYLMENNLDLLKAKLSEYKKIEKQNG